MVKFAVMVNAATSAKTALTIPVNPKHVPTAFPVIQRQAIAIYLSIVGIRVDNVIPTLVYASLLALEPHVAHRHNNPVVMIACCRGRFAVATTSALRDLCAVVIIACFPSRYVVATEFALRGFYAVENCADTHTRFAALVMCGFVRQAINAVGLTVLKAPVVALLA
jgi:hypothetical protein